MYVVKLTLLSRKKQDGNSYVNKVNYMHMFFHILKPFIIQGECIDCKYNIDK